MTIKLVENKLSDRGLQIKNPDLRVVQEKEPIEAGAFTIEFIHVNHSIADANALAICSPAGTVVHTGDFKVDFTPIYGDVIDLNRLAALGTEGVLALISESTNVEVPGMSSSERTVGATFQDLFSRATVEFLSQRSHRTSIAYSKSSRQRNALIAKSCFLVGACLMFSAQPMSWAISRCDPTR